MNPETAVQHKPLLPGIGTDREGEMRPWAFRASRHDAMRLPDLGALGNHLAFCLSDHRHDANHNLVGLWHVGCHEWNASILQAKQERCVTRKTCRA